MQPIIEVQHIGKRYTITHQRGGYIALRDVFAAILRRPFAFLKTKAKQATGLAKREEFWALKDVTFSVQKGEIVGIIGRNGAGKSTLLKILTGITPPTRGEIRLRGRVASLLEVGTGFHPELTGRENIFLNGAILGMSRDEIARKFSEIVAFAGVEQFLDTPTKFYSSGMTVRLGFSIAAHLEPDILLVDEVLAVGDAEFQKKCLGKMEEVTQKEGRTILFVSHNMAAVRNLCTRAVLLNKGQVEMEGRVDEVIDHYLATTVPDERATYEFDEQDTPASIRKVSITDDSGAPQTRLPISKPFALEVEFSAKQALDNVALSVLFYSQDGDLLLYSSDADTTGALVSYKPGLYRARIEVPAFLFNVGGYTFDILVHSPNVALYAQAKDMGFEIDNVESPRSVVFLKSHPGKIAVPLAYSVKKA